MDRSSPNQQRPRQGRRSVDGFLTSGPRKPIRDSRGRIAPPSIPKPNLQPATIPSSRPVQSPVSRIQNRQSQLSSPVSSKKRDRSQFKEKGHNSRMLKFRRVLAGFVALVLIISFTGGSWIGWKFLKDTSKVFGGSIASNIGDLFTTTRLKGESNGRVNILLAGDSADDPGHGGADLTDSIMVVSIDTKNNTGFLLSIPRDLWVDIPSLGHQKINAANDVNGFQSSGLPSGGMGQLEQIVEQDLGIPVDYYALIDYTAFKNAVDAVGGITVNIQSPDPRGLYDAFTHLKLPNGMVNLDGQQALDLARARGDDSAGDVSYGFPQSDFDRTMHQREMLVALKSKATTLGVVSNPIKIGQLFDAFGNNVHTDLNLADVLRGVQLTKGITNSSIQSLTYSESGTNPLLVNYYDPSSGQDALIPKAGIDNFSQLQAYYQQLTSSNPVVRENASVVVLNGTSTTGLAKTAQTKLATKGVSVSKIADATTTYTTTTIIDNSKGQDPATLALLKGLYGKNVTTQQLATDPSNPDFIVILGSDQISGSTSSSTN